MIAVTDHGEVRELRLNHPPVNALSEELMASLRRSLEDSVRDKARAIVLSGAPQRFCAGLDVPLMMTLDRQAIERVFRELYALLRALASSPVPIAAAITGHAPAGGTALALFCDWRVMAEGEWKLGLSEVGVGLSLPPVIFSALSRQIGPRKAECLAAGGLLISPAEAARSSLVDEVVPMHKAVPRAIEWCDAMLALPRHAMAMTRKQARSDLVRLFDRDLETEIREGVANWSGEEAQSVLKNLVVQLRLKTGK
jgi:3,2-trans-enoyl-CoA isomerase